MALGACLPALLTGCIEGKKPTPLKRVSATAPAPVELKAQPEPPEKGQDKPDKPD
jgi:hypothetical protein